MRDGYRCTLTGHYDFGSITLHPELRDRITAHPTTCVTQCAHIFSETAQNGEQKVQLSAQFQCDASSDEFFLGRVRC